MSYSPGQLEKIATNYEKLAAKTEKKKLDPKAKVRNRGTVCVPAESAKDKKDHFPINDEGQARNALARVQQLSSAPWYNGSLEGLKALVSRKVKAKYPKINVGGKDKKSSVEVLLEKYAQAQAPDYDAGQPGTQNPAEQSETDAWRFMQKGETAEPNPPGMNWVVKDDVRQLAPASAPAVPQSGGWAGQTIDPIFQKMLGVTPDGKLGTQTQHALNRYKAGRNYNMTNALAYEYLKREPEYATQSEMQYDDNSNTYVSSAKQASLEALMKRYGQTIDEEDKRIDKLIDQELPPKQPEPPKKQKIVTPKGDLEFGRKSDVLKTNPPVKASLEILEKRYG